MKNNIAIKDFVDNSYRLLIIRPRWRTADNADSVWKNAMKLVGKNYDFLGAIGFNFPASYYCSELAVSIFKEWFNEKEKFPHWRISIAVSDRRSKIRTSCKEPNDK